jgi:hypothetical protein
MMNKFNNPSHNELPNEEELGKMFSGMGWPEVLLFTIFLVPAVVLPLLLLLANTFRIIIGLIIK